MCKKKKAKEKGEKTDAVKTIAPTVRVEATKISRIGY